MDEDVDSYFLPGGILDSPSKDDLDHPPHSLPVGVAQQLFPPGYGLRAPPSSTNVSRVLGAPMSSTTTTPAPPQDLRLPHGEETRFRRLSMEGTNPMAKEFTPAIAGSETSATTNPHSFFPLETGGGHYHDIEEEDGHPLGSLSSPSQIESNLFRRSGLLASPPSGKWGNALPFETPDSYTCCIDPDVDLSSSTSRGGGLGAGMLSSPILPSGTAVQSSSLTGDSVLFPELSPRSTSHRAQHVGLIGRQVMPGSSSKSSKQVAPPSPNPVLTDMAPGMRSKGSQGPTAASPSSPNHHQQGGMSATRGPLLPTKTWPQSANMEAGLKQQASTSLSSMQPVTRAGPLEDISPILQGTGTGRGSRGSSSSSVKKHHQESSHQQSSGASQEKGGAHQHRASLSGSGSRARENRASTAQHEGQSEPGRRNSWSGGKSSQQSSSQTQGGFTGKDRGGRRTRWAKVGTTETDDIGNDARASTLVEDTGLSTGKATQSTKSGTKVSSAGQGQTSHNKKERGVRSQGKQQQQTQQQQLSQASSAPTQQHTTPTITNSQSKTEGRTRQQSVKKESGKGGRPGEGQGTKEKGRRRERETGIVFARNSFSPILEGYGGSSGEEPSVSDEIKSEGAMDLAEAAGLGSGGDTSESENTSDASTVSSLTDETSSHNSRDALVVTTPGPATVTPGLSPTAATTTTTTTTTKHPVTQASPTAPSEPVALRPGKKVKERAAVVTTAPPVSTAQQVPPAASLPDPSLVPTFTPPLSSATPAPVETSPPLMPEPPTPLITPLPAPQATTASPREPSVLPQSRHQRTKSKGGQPTTPSASSEGPSQESKLLTKMSQQPPTPSQASSLPPTSRTRDDMKPLRRLKWGQHAYKPLTFLLLRLRKAGLMSLVAGVMSWVLDLAMAAIGFSLAVLLAILLIILQLHRYALTELITNSNLALCFAFPYGFKSLMGVIGDWAPHWGSVLLWYSFLFQLFCTTGKVHGIHSSSSSSSTPLVLPAHFFRILLPLLFIAEGISRKSYLLDLSGSELLLLSFLLAALKMKRLTSPLFLLTWAFEVLAVNYLNTNHPLWQYSQLIISLTALHGLSLIDLIASQHTQPDESRLIRGHHAMALRG